jgi:hypothetical protein
LHLNPFISCAGAVYIFARSGSTWSQQGRLSERVYDTLSSLNFGAALSLSGDGNLLAVGAVGDESAATGIDGDPAPVQGYANGAVHVYARSNGQWNKQAYIKASNTKQPSGQFMQLGDSFGCSVALSNDGKTLIVGAYREDSAALGVNGNQLDDSQTEAGAVYVFSRDSGAWRQEAYVKASPLVFPSTAVQRSVSVAIARIPRSSSPARCTSSHARTRRGPKLPT